MQLQCDEAETKFIAPQLLVTNLEIKLKPHKKRTKFLRARIDTCANMNLMPISVYQLLYKDPDCVMLASSSKSGISTYTTEKIPVLASCDLFVHHPDIRCLQEVTFQVVNHEGSVIVSCVTSPDLGLIQPHGELNVSVPDCGRLTFSSVDHPNKYQNEKIESSSSVSDNVYGREVQYPIVSKVPETEVNQHVTQKIQNENKQHQCPAQTDTVLQDRTCQKVKNAYMRPQKPKCCELQSRKPAIKCKKENKVDQIVMLPHKPATKVKKPGQANHKDVLQNKNCSNVKIVNMQPQKPSLSDEQLKKPATMYKYKKHQEEIICYDKQYQETKQSVCEGKKCPSTQCSDRQPVKPVIKHKDV